MLRRIFPTLLFVLTFAFTASANDGGTGDKRAKHKDAGVGTTPMQYEYDGGSPGFDTLVPNDDYNRGSGSTRSDGGSIGNEPGGGPGMEPDRSYDSVGDAGTPSGRKTQGRAPPPEPRPNTQPPKDSTSAGTPIVPNDNMGKDDVMPQTDLEKQSAARLSGKTIAIIAIDGVDEDELLRPKEAFEREGAKTVVLAPMKGRVQTYKGKDKGEKIDAEMSFDEARPAMFDLALVPGAFNRPDGARIDPHATAYLKSFAQAGKLIAAVGHGPEVLAQAGLVKGKTITSAASMKADLKKAGAKWVDEKVAADGNLITVGRTDDIPVFVDKVVDLVNHASAGQKRTSM